MADLTPFQDPETVKQIYALYKKRSESDPPRHHLGGSQIGDECARKLWYQVRWVRKQDTSGRMYRLLNTGHREEERLIADLRAIGCTVWDKDPETGRQFRYEACGGRFACSLDGVIENLPDAPLTPHVFEAKTSNTKVFKQVKSKGVKEVKRQHYDQMMIGMGMSGLTRAAYFMVCKETDEIYMERINFNKKEFDALMRKAESVINAKTPPVKLNQDPSYYLCKWCEFSEVCHEKKPADVSCKTCRHAKSLLAGERERCGLCLEPTLENHLYEPNSIPYADHLQDGDGWTLYHYNGKRFLNVAADSFPGMDLPHHSSRELRELHPEAAISEEVAMAKEVLGGVVTNE